METLPTELLVNILERLNFKDIGNYRLLNRRCDEIIMKYVYKSVCKLEICTRSNKSYNVSLISREESPFLSRFIVYSNAIHVFYYKNDEFARLVARRLGAPDPVSDTFSDAQVVKYSGIRETLKVTVQVVQLNHTINTLEIDSNVGNDILDCIVSQLPKNSIRNLIILKPNESKAIIRVINQIGLEGIRYIRIHDAWNVTNSTDMMDAVLPKIPRINLNTGPYRVSFSLVRTVIQEWLYSDWIISLCSFDIPGTSNWRDRLMWLNAKVLSTVKKSSKTTEVFRFTRESDAHILLVIVEYFNGGAKRFLYPVKIKLYEDKRNKDKDCIL